VVNSKVSIPHGAFIAYIFGTATTPPDSIKIDTGNVDTFQTRKLTICNRANVNAYLNKIAIPPGLGRIYELQNGQWTYYNNTNTTFDKDPYITELPFGSTTYSIEKYANGIGLVYKEMIMWDYQPSSASKTGFGIKLTMIDHN
jgi:DNA modification methylase